ncbi:type VI secretion system ImpA family N-terminal domain-containing protein [Aliarcobacter skirrowii]|uniref:type VI secretion system ImpA family N-terminal domain-containing protein n=1 Tax=Aliarcobacter skirrowii TaxID=28200 RepID=UPI0029BE82C5|nr:type VI secretion system ImpA family N-terminal domain-containing protein [Aliarcobacter skirrowii]MDX4036239.1 type VI secretion system ImpA family N-terminal domain-containing protein [Aliarcobacter skirrowii]
MIRKSILQEINDVVGKDCKYEDSYLNIEIEIDKISSVTQDTCDFRTVLSECENLLSKDTKDFKIATWWFYTNFKINQIEGLKYSIDCFIEFINKFYTSFYPKSKISKTNIIEWLETTLTKEIENNSDDNPYNNTLKRGSLIYFLVESHSTSRRYMHKELKEFLEKVGTNR